MRDTVNVGDATIEYDLRGTGDPVVMIPGGAVDIDYYDALAQALVKAGYRTVAVNPRGMGASTGPLDGLTLDTLAGTGLSEVTVPHAPATTRESTATPPSRCRLDSGRPSSYAFPSSPG